MSPVADILNLILAHSIGKTYFSSISLMNYIAYFFAISLVPTNLMLSFKSSIAFKIIEIGKGI